MSLNPIWYYSGVTKDLKPGITVGIPFGDPNVGWTSQAVGGLAAWQWIHGKVPWWNPYSGFGLPLAAEMQPGAFFLPFILLLLLTNGFIWLRIAMQLVAGFSTLALARELQLGRLAALAAGILFELDGVFTFTTGPDSAFCAAAFLPLILLGIEHIAKPERRHTGTLWLALGIGFSVLAGFPEIAYIDGLLALVWAICRFAVVEQRLRFALRVAWGGLLGLLLTAPLLMPFWSLVRGSSAFANHQQESWAIRTTSIPSLFAPYIYGPFPFATKHIEGFDVWYIGTYVGIVVTFCAVLGLHARQSRWLRLLLVIWVALSLARTYNVRFLIRLTNHIPFFRETNFFRYSPPSWTFCLILLAAFGIEELRHKPKLRYAVLLSAVVLAISIHIAWPWRHYWHSDPAEITVMSRYFVLGLGWTLAGLLFVIFTLIVLPGEKRRVPVVAIMALQAAVFFCLPMLSAPRSGSIDWPAINFLRRNLGLLRFYSLQPFQCNYGAYFRLAGLDYTSFPVPENLFRYITDHLFPVLPTVGGAVFWPAAGWYQLPDYGLSYLCKLIPEYEAVGVKYVVADSSTAPKLAPRAEVPGTDQGSQPLVLKPGEHVQLTVPVPQNPSSSDNMIDGVGVSIGTYGNTADGELGVRVCATGTCAEGTRPLSESIDNHEFDLPLSPPLRVAAGKPVTITVSHRGGVHNVALWISLDLPGQDQHLLGSDGKLIPGKAAHVSFTYHEGSLNLPKVYHDSLIDIFELPHPAPYYSIESGGPCHLDSLDRESLHAECEAPALLVRRELYMPGWHALLAGKHLEAQPYKNVFQAFDLPRGESHLRFSYAPPRSMLAACLSLLAGVALLAEVVLAFRDRQTAAKNHLRDATA